MYIPGGEETIEGYRKRRVKEYSDAYDKISMVLFSYDPIGLNFEENIDEYEYEAARVIVQAKEASTPEELAERIRKVFIEAFDKQLANRKKEVYPAIAREVWEIMERGHVLVPIETPKNRLLKKFKFSDFTIGVLVLIGICVAVAGSYLLFQIVLFFFLVLTGGLSV